MKKLSQSQIAQYHDDGFLFLRNLFSEEYVLKLRSECARLWQTMEVSDQNPRIQWRMGQDGGRVADRIDPLLDISDCIADAAMERFLIEPVSQILGCESADIFKAKLISKWPGTFGYKLHQDYMYWQDSVKIAPECFVTALLALDPFTPTSGALEFFPELHHRRIRPPKPGSKDADEAALGLSRGILAELEPGDVLLFHPMTPHRSGANLSDSNRESLFFSYVTPDNGDVSADYYENRPIDFMES